MPEYIRTRTILANRNNPNHGKLSKSKESVILPAFAYKVYVTELNKEDNFIKKTVIALARIKKAEGLDTGAVYDYVSEKLNLDRILIKAILKKSDNDTDRATGEEAPNQSGNFYYVLYDPIQREFYPKAVSAEEYEDNTWSELLYQQRIDFTKEGHEAAFQSSPGNPPIYALTMCVGESLEDAPRQPTLPDWQIRRYFGQGVHTISFTGEKELIGVYCVCYLDEKNLSGIHVMSPIGKGDMPWLFDSIQKGREQYASYNEELAERLLDLDRTRRICLEETEAYKLDAVKEETLLRYPGINKYEDLWEQVSHFCGIVNISREQLTDKDRSDVLISFHSALEELFYIALKNNMPQGDENRAKYQGILTYIESLVGHEDQIFEFLARMAESIGFPENECETFFNNKQNKRDKLRIGMLKDILKKAASGEEFKKSLPEMTIALTVEAFCNELHPFRLVPQRSQNFFCTIRESLDKRNYYMHGTENQTTIAADDIALPDYEEIIAYRALVDWLLEMVQIKTVSDAERKHNAEVLQNKRNARIMAAEKLNSYPSLKDKLEDCAKEQLFSFYFQDPDYYKSSYNLLSDTIGIILEEKSVEAQRKRAADSFTKSIGNDADEIESILAKYGCTYHSEDRPNTRKMIAQLKSRRFTLKNKFFLIVKLLDAEDPCFLQELLNTAPALPDCIDKVCIWRGHNNLANFNDSDDGYEAFQQALITTCEDALVLLLEGE